MKQRIRDKTTKSSTRRRIGVRWLVCAVVLAAAGAAVVYKAHTAGIQYDEALTLQDYCRNLHQARHNYKSTNNHVLNSVCICISQVLFGDYEHFIRIPTIVCSLAFIAAMGYVVRRTIEHGWLQMAVLVFLFCTPWVFQYLYPARGYSYAMAAMAGALALTMYLGRHPILPHNAWIVVLLMSVLNFVALGAMITSLFVVVAWTAVFALWWSSRIHSRHVKGWVRLAVYGPGIAAGTAGLVYWFYRPILAEILAAAKNPYVAEIAASWNGWRSFKIYLDELLTRGMIGKGALGWWLAIACVALMAGGGIVRLARAVATWRQKRNSAKQAGALGPKAPAPPGRPGSHNGLFVLAVLAVYFVELFVYTVVLRKSPGLTRSHVFLLPLLVMAGGWLIDGWLGAKREVDAAENPNETKRGRKSAALACEIVLAAVIIATAVQHLPRMRPGRGEMSRPTLRRLQAIEPARTWSLCFSPEMIMSRMGFTYYLRRNEYAFRLTSPEAAHVIITTPEEAPAGMPCVMRNYFLRACDCVLLLNARTINPGSTSLRPYVDLTAPQPGDGRDAGNDAGAVAPSTD